VAGRGRGSRAGERRQGGCAPAWPRCSGAWGKQWKGGAVAPKRRGRGEAGARRRGEGAAVRRGHSGGEVARREAGGWRRGWRRRRGVDGGSPRHAQPYRRVPAAAHHAPRAGRQLLSSLRFPPPPPPPPPVAGPRTNCRQCQSLLRLRLCMQAFPGTGEVRERSRLGLYAGRRHPSPPLSPPPCAALLFKNRPFGSRAKKGGSQGHCRQRGRGVVVDTGWHVP